MKERILKSIKLFTIALMFSVLFIGQPKAADENIVNAIKNRGDGSELKSASGVVIGTKISSEYGFGFSAQKGTTVTFSGQEAIPSDIRGYFAHPSDGGAQSECLNKNGGSGETMAKSGYSAYYSNVGIYNDKIIDVKATVVDFQAAQEDNEFNERFKDNNGNVVHKSLMRFGAGININVDNVRYVKIKFEFFDHDTKKAISVKGNTSYYDVDARQGIVMHDGNKGLYVANTNNTLRIGSALGGKYVFSNSNDNVNDQDYTYCFTELFEGSSITRTLTFSAYVNNGWDFGSGFMGFDGNSVVPAEPSTPSKKASKTEVKPNEEYTYTISQKVNQSLGQYYYKSFKFVDQLEPVLDVNQANVSVKNAKGEDVTNRFDISVSDQTVTAAAKADFVTSGDFYGDTYSLIIKTKIKEGADLSSYLKGNNYEIPNKASVVIRDYGDTEITKETKVVKVIYKKYVLTVHHYLEGTTTKLANDESYIKDYNDDYSTSRSSSISNEYVLVSTPSNASGKITQDTVVTYYYRKDAGTVVDVPKTAAAISIFALVFSLITIVVSGLIIYNIVYKKKKTN